MIKNAKLAKEIAVTVVNKIGVLADMARIVAGHGINIIAVSGYAVGKNATILLVTDDNLRAADALKKARYKSLKEKEVLVVELEDKPGALKNLTARLDGAGIDIKEAYGTTCPDGCPARIVVSTSNNDKALVLFRKK